MKLIFSFENWIFANLKVCHDILAISRILNQMPKKRFFKSKIHWWAKFISFEMIGGSVRFRKRLRSNIHFLIKPLRPDLLKSSLSLAAFMVPTFFTVAHLPSQIFALKIQESPTKLSQVLDNTSLQCHELFCKQNPLYSYGTKAWWLKFKYSNLFTAFFSLKTTKLIINSFSFFLSPTLYIVQNESKIQFISIQFHSQSSLELGLE